MKKIFIKITMFITTVLALSTCSIYALDVVDGLDGVLVVVNDGRPVPAYDGIVSADQLSSGNSLAVSTIDFYVPFEAPSNTVVVRLSLLCASANLSVSGDVQAGAYSGGVFFPHYNLSYSQWDYGYSTVDGVALTNTGYSVNTSSVPAADFAWFVHFRISGDATLLLRSAVSSTGSLSLDSSLVTLPSYDISVNGDGGITTAATNITTTGSVRSYYDASHYVNVALSGLIWKFPQQTSVFHWRSSSGSAKPAAYAKESVRSGSINLSNNPAVLSPIRLTATRTDDDAEAVAELQKANATLTNISGNMQKIVDHMNETNDAADNIGGTTSDDTISNTSTDFNSGSGTLDDFTDTATDQLDTMTAAGSGYAALMAAALPVMLNFGPGSLGPLHIALLVIVAVMGITFFIRRLL